MELAYGPYLPLRVLEEIGSWKDAEKEYIDIILSIVPNLESPYVKLLDEWKSVFERTSYTADDWKKKTKEVSEPANEYMLGQMDVLLQTCFSQSKEFHRQLGHLLSGSESVAKHPSAKVILEYIRNQCEKNINQLKPLDRPNAVSTLINKPAYTNAQQRDDWDEEPFPYPEVARYDRLGEEDFTAASTVSSQADTYAGVSLEANAQEASGPPETPVPIGGHKLPPLPYAYNALEPYIDEKTMRIHHDKHHKTYVDDLNKAEKKLQEARKDGDFELVKHWERELAFNGAGHYLHTIFWNIMNPKGGGKPTGSLGEQIRKDFGSYEAFKKHFTEAANKVEGGGWAVLVWSPRSHRLEILQAEKHQNLSQYDIVPLLPLDVWEHAYYLKHQNERKRYITDWWNVVYWPEVSERFMEARKLRWAPY
ncbi:Fe-Mn family superoxide dismutase [Paenibacillus polygoni]|uniref:superoxide dismutase n=1 Tax=Paenibacillus polygoni TaxID=3050112 RepID=A0ABY8X2F0_9BACL|nr:Fe-Mn family superoxide dismutase [Paenibacillus polygoni]WIV19702.1 Fe-Mn family superoxide dismutase [Paenibacillus polygoni]